MEILEKIIDFLIHIRWMFPIVILLLILKRSSSKKSTTPGENPDPYWCEEGWWRK
jgi:hypothetical protein